MSYSVSSPYPTSEQPYRIQPVEMVPPPALYSPDTAARLAYAERGSYGEALARMFAEAEANPAAYDPSPADHSYGETLFGQRDKEAYQEVMTKVYDGLKSSDIINDFRFHSRQVESEHDIEAIFRAYSRSLESALKHANLTAGQEAALRHASHSELDFGMRDIITRHAVAGAEADDPTFDPSEYLLILDPKLRKVDYMDSKEILKTLRRSASLESKDRLKADLAVLERSQRQEAKTALHEFTNE